MCSFSKYFSLSSFKSVDCTTEKGPQGSVGLLTPTLLSAAVVSHLLICTQVLQYLPVGVSSSLSEVPKILETPAPYLIKVLVRGTEELPISRGTR